MNNVDEVFKIIDSYHPKLEQILTYSSIIITLENLLNTCTIKPSGAEALDKLLEQFNKDTQKRLNTLISLFKTRLDLLSNIPGKLKPRDIENSKLN